jgi:hypothetical protein
MENNRSRVSRKHRVSAVRAAHAMSFRAPDPKGKDAAQERRRQLEEWKARRASQGAGRTSLGGGARQPFDSRRGSLSSVASARNSTATPKTGTTSRLRRSFAGATPASVEQSTSGRKSSSVRAPLAPENGSMRRKSAAVGPRGSASKSTEKPKSSGKKATVTRATPSPPEVGSRDIAHQHDIYPTTHATKSPPSAGATKLVPSPDAVSCVHGEPPWRSGGAPQPRRRQVAAHLREPREPAGGDHPEERRKPPPPEHSGPSRRTRSAARACSAAPQDSPPGPMQTLHESGGKAAALEAARAAREAHAAAGGEGCRAAGEAPRG